MHDFKVVAVIDVGLYTYGLVNHGEPDIVVKTTALPKMMSTLLHDVADYLVGKEVKVDMVINGQDIGWIEGFRIRVRKVSGKELFKHFAVNRDLYPNTEWIQLMLPDPEMRLPGEEGFISSAVNPDTLIEDELDLFYGDRE